jgi:hypothetical protein
MCALLWYAALTVSLFAEESSVSRAAETKSPPVVPSKAPADRPGEKPAAGQTLFGWNLVWSGAWEEGEILRSQGDLRLLLPASGLVVRGEIIDRRPLDPGFDPPFRNFEQGLTNYGGGVYHKPTGSRLLYGILDEWGLPARLRNPWTRGLPFAENHRPSTADIKTAISSAGEPETFLYLGSPGLELFRQNPEQAIQFRGFAAARIDRGINPGFTGGLETRFGKTAALRLDGFFTEKTLPPRKSSSWFSENPPLPERNFRLSALGLLFDIPGFTLSSDWAYSETFAWGRDLYGNLGLRFTRILPANRGRWALSLAADGAGGRYTGRDGSIPGAGFRSGGKFEWHDKRSGLLRFSTSLRAPAFGEVPNRSSSNIFWRLPAPGKNSAGVFRFTRISLGAGRNASDPAEIFDSLDLGLGFRLNPRIFFGSTPASGTARGFFNSPVNFSVSGVLKGVTAAEGRPFAYPFPTSAYRFDSAGMAGELYWSPGIFQFRAKAGCRIKNGKDAVWETAASAGVRFKPGRFSVKVSSPDFPNQWKYTLSWRMEKK